MGMYQTIMTEKHQFRYLRVTFSLPSGYLLATFLANPHVGIPMWGPVINICARFQHSRGFLKTVCALL